MAEIITPSGLPTEDTGMRSGDLIEKYNPVSGQNEKIDYKNFNSEGLYLSSGRKAFQELTSGALSVSGWYKIAELPSDTSLVEANCEIDIVSRFNNGGCSFALFDRSITEVKTHSNQNIKKIRNSEEKGIEYRIAKSDTISLAGIGVEAFLPFSSPETANIQISKNIGRQSEVGIVLVDPVLSDGLCPDGVTPATFLEAGAELKLGISGSTYMTDFGCYKATPDQIRVSLTWDGNPKQGTGISISGGTVTFWDGAGNTITLGSHTISDFKVSQNRVYFKINQAGAFTSLNAGFIGFRVASEVILTITG